MKFLINKFTISLVVIALFGAGSWVFFRGGEESVYDTLVVERQDLIQDISTTGRVEAVSRVDLAFERAGRVTRVHKDIGDTVRAGDALVSLDGSEESAQLAQAQARLSKDRINLDELRRGSRIEEIQVQEVKVANAEKALEDAKRALVDTLQDSYTKADDAIRNKIDQLFTRRNRIDHLFTSPGSIDPQLNNTYFEYSPQNIETGRVSVEKMFKKWVVSLDLLTTELDLEQYASDADQNLLQVKGLLGMIGPIVNDLTPTSNLTQTKIDGWKADVSTARSNVNTAVTNLSMAREKLKSANSSLALAKQELTLQKSGATLEQIIAQEAQINEAEANVKFFQAQLDKLSLRSPVTGIVTEQNAKVGMLTSPSTVVASVISEGHYEVEAFIVEADIANLNVGDVATLTLDAYGEDIVFDATVIKINPAGELQEGVANYKTTLEFSVANDKIKAGMTADIDIVTDRRQGVLAIPERAIIFKDGMKIVRILNPDESTREVEVSTGITGGRGLIEITSGLAEGDIIITGSKK